jgi:site-specific DNA recombinase
MSEKRRVVTYERVSSEDQKDRETILTQSEELERHLSAQPDVEIVGHYLDNGVSGTIPFADRPQASLLLAAARRGEFEEVWVYKLDRVGRDEIDPLVVYRTLEKLVVRLRSLHDDLENPLLRSLLAAVSAEERRSFLRRTADGTNRAARQGRPLGGIVPYGYRVVGLKKDAVWAIDDQPIWGGKSAADIVRWIYELLAFERKSCRWIAAEFNRLGVPTTDQRDGRVRKVKTQPRWRSSRIRNLVKNPCYRGEYQYGRRADTEREIIVASMPGVVSPEIWDAAQQTLTLHRINPATGVRRGYLLRGVVRCGICGLNYCGVNGKKDVFWYRCNGQLVERGPIEGKCVGKSIRGDAVERIVWDDVEAWLRNPDELLNELEAEAEHASQRAAGQDECRALETRLVELEAERKRAIALHVKGTLAEDELDQMLEELAKQRRAVEDRLVALSPADEPEPPIPADLLAELRARIDAGFDMATRQEIVRNLVRRILVHTTVGEPGKKSARVVVEYRFPESGVVPNCTHTGSSRRQWTGHS